MRLPFLAALLAALALGACSLPVMDKEADAAARTLFEEVRTGADISKDPRLDPELKDPQSLVQLQAVRRLIPTAAPTKVDNRGWNFNTVNGDTKAELVHAYHFPDRVLIVQTVLRKKPGQKTWLIVGFHVRADGADERKQQPPPITGEGPAVHT